MGIYDINFKLILMAFVPSWMISQCFLALEVYTTFYLRLMEVYLLWGYCQRSFKSSGPYLHPDTPERGGRVKRE